MRWLILAALLAAGAQAGPGEGTTPTVESPLLWLHADAECDCPWLSNVKNEGSDHYAGWGQGTPTVAPPGIGAITVTFPMDPSPTEAIALNASEPIVIVAYIGGGEGGVVNVTPELRANDDVVMRGPPREAVSRPGAPAEVRWEIGANVDQIPADATVELEFKVAGAFADAYFMTIGDTWSHVILPVESPMRIQDQPTPAVTGPPSETTTSTAPSPTMETSTSTRPPPKDEGSGETGAPDESTPTAAFAGAVVMLGIALCLENRRRS